MEMVAAYAEGKNILHNLVRVGGYGYTKQNPYYIIMLTIL